ncbi:MAG: multicopper oxidase domain-containing protein [Actinomycetota bacterium]|nr:multicopper oxidase domain-containing protein [Actinomycetota bacterium]
MTAAEGVSRRRFLGGVGATALGLLWVPSGARVGVSSARRLRAIPHPQYREPIADPTAIPRFVQPLAVPAELGTRLDLTAGGSVSIEMAETTADVLGVGLATPMWGYGPVGRDPTSPGPTIVAHRDRPVEVRWANRLPTRHLAPVDTTLHWAYSHQQHSIAEAGVPAVVHLHGGHVDAAFDGGPEQWFTARGDTGPDFVSSAYWYDNGQEAATLWYHDHTLGISRLNVYAGLAGFYLLRDDRETELIQSGRLPADRHEVELVIQDRMFYPDGRLAYPDAPAVWPGWPGGPSQQVDFFGEVILVNGRAWPYLRVEPRPYRLRLLNGSDSRVYELSVRPSPGGVVPMTVIGTDGGFLDRPVPLTGPLVLAPGERADVIVDFAAHAGQTLTVTNLAPTPFPLGLPPSPLTAEVLELRVDLPLAGGPAPGGLPDRLRESAYHVPAMPATTRRLVVGERLDRYGRLQMLLGTTDLGHLEYAEPATETPRLGDVEVWELYNDTPASAHPVHLHLVSFEVLDRAPFLARRDPATGALHDITVGPRRPPPPPERGPKDTVLVHPGEVARIRVRFDRPGRSVWHCHNLSHEDHEMMRPLVISPLLVKR